MLRRSRILFRWAANGGVNTAVIARQSRLLARMAAVAVTFKPSGP
jgi:hypothetical protein